MSKAHKKLAEVLAPYGLRYVVGKRHGSIVDKNDKFVTSVSCSPSDPYFARQTIRCLVRDGLVPASLKQEKF